MRCKSKMKCINYTDDRHKVELSFETFIEAKGYCWFASVFYNGLFRFSALECLEMKNDISVNAEFVGIFPRENNRQRLWSWIESYDEYLIFVPLCADNITIYNIERNEFITFPIKEPENLTVYTISYNNMAKFSTCIKRDNSIVFLPYTYPAIVVLNFETMKLVYYEQPIYDMSVYLEKYGPF